jgi:DNA-binding transcriptional MerR regulator
VEQYSVKKLAALAGVSVRTLHLYDQIGLLKPSVRTEKNYRLYGRSELLRLQQILFYKELDLPLKEIADILDDPAFDPVKALENHKAALQHKQQRIATLLVTIDKTIDQLKNEDMLQPEDLYEGFPPETVETWRQLAVEHWGDKVERSRAHLLKKTKQEYKQLQQAAAQNWQNLFNLCNKDPQSEAVQKEIAIHYELIREFWGTAGSADNQAAAYAGLGDLYVADERYTLIEGKPQPEFAKFMQQAMKYFAERLK